MNKKGFTLIEILTVIAIISFITVIAIPSINSIKNNINKRQYNTKLEIIVKAAEIYAQNNPDIFNAQNQQYVTVETLINKGYLEPDAENNVGKCNSESGCLIDPRCEGYICKESMNSIQILLTKEQAGVKAVIEGVKCDPNSTNSNDKCKGGELVLQVCERFNSLQFKGKWGTNSNDYCGCKMNANGEPIGLYKAVVNNNSLSLTNDSVKSCLISGDEINNYLEYDGVMWRVMGVYELSDGELYGKIITNNTVG